MHGELAIFLYLHSNFWAFGLCYVDNSKRQNFELCHCCSKQAICSYLIKFKPWFLNTRAISRLYQNKVVAQINPFKFRDKVILIKKLYFLLKKRWFIFCPPFSHLSPFSCKSRAKVLCRQGLFLKYLSLRETDVYTSPWVSYWHEGSPSPLKSTCSKSLDSRDNTIPIPCHCWNAPFIQYKVLLLPFVGRCSYDQHFKGVYFLLFYLVYSMPSRFESMSFVANLLMSHFKFQKI